MKRLLLVVMLMLCVGKVSAATSGEDAGHFFGAYVVTDICQTAFEHDPQLHDKDGGLWIGVGCGVLASFISENSNHDWQWDRFGSDIGGVLLSTLVESRVLRMEF